MAIRSFCDRCGEEIQTVIFKVKAGVKDYDFCDKCKSAFDLFMKSDTILKNT